MNNETYKTDFRNHLASVDNKGRRNWINPTKPKGRFYTARILVSWLLLLPFLFLAPLIKLNGEPLLLFNIIERKFVVFGLIFWPQDFYLFVLAAITLIVFIVLFTAVFGRLFCGWICPQTIFLETVFRKIEYLIEGSAGNQRRLNDAPWTASKIFKKTLKQIIFFALSFLIGNVLLAYIIGYDALYLIITAPPAEHIVGLTFTLLFSGLFYFIFAWFREQACTLVCPYGRLQSVLLDHNSIVIAYNHKRGETRGTLERGQDFSDRGHCIDCDACVKICPTGIDIRNGIQLECINCTACIDACDNVMDKVKLPRGLISYTSVNSIEKGEKFRFTPRIILYSVALLFLLTLSSTLIFSRNNVETTILRTAGMMYQETDNGNIRNLYNIKLVNKTNKERVVSLNLKAPDGFITLIGDSLSLPKNGMTESVFFIDIKANQIYSPNSMVTIEVLAGDELLDEISSNFVGPNKAGGNK